MHSIEVRAEVSAALAAQDNQDLPFEQVVEIVQPPRRLSHSPLFQVMFAWQNNEQVAIDLPDLRVEPAPVALDKVKFDLDLSLTEWAGRIVGSLGYATALFDEATIERHREYLITLLRAMVAEHIQELGRLGDRIIQSLRAVSQAEPVATPHAAPSEAASA